MRLAFCGKGGSGKSSVVGVCARLLARRGHPTLVLDSDVMPGLAGALGMPSTDAPIPDEAVEEGEDGGPRWRLRTGLTAEQAVDRYALRGPDDVRLLQIGKLRLEGAWTIAASQHAFRQIAAELPAERWHLLGDLPGGTRQPFFGWGQFADTTVAVVEPTVKSFMTGRRLKRLADAPDGPRLVVLATKVRSRADVDRIAEEVGLPVVGAVPWDDAITEADRRGVALLDHAPDAPAVVALEAFLEQVEERTPAATAEGTEDQEVRT